MDGLQEVRIAVEIMSLGGPTGAFGEALEVEVRDYGGNVLWSGPASSYYAKRLTWHIPTRLVATKIGRRSGCYSEVLALDGDPHA